MAAARRGPLRRAEIVAAAIQLVDEEGFDQLSTRRLAARLGVSPMALYRHASGKDEILEAVVDHLLAEREVPDIELSWQGWLRWYAVDLRELSAAHPGILELFLHRPLLSAVGARRVGGCMDAMKRAGVDADDAVRRLIVVSAYAIGFCALEAAGAASRDASPLLLAELFRFGLDRLVAGLDREAAPRS